MKQKILFLAALFLLATCAWGQGGQASYCNGTTKAACQNQQGPVVSGTTLYITNSVGGTATNFSYVIAGSPATVSIVLSGCMANGTCDTCDTYTTVANSNRTPNNWSTTTCNSVVYDYYKIVPTMATGGLFTVNATVSIAAINGGSVGTGGDTLTSPNSTIVVGGSISNTTVDLAGAAGKIMGGATPALTYTPILGVDNSSAGTLQTANGSANAHTTWGSAATTSNTILGPAVVLPTGTVPKCTTSSTTCTIAPSPIVDNGTKIVVTEPIQSASVAFASLPTPTAGMEIYCSDCQVTTAATCTTVSPADCVCKAMGNGAFARYMNYQGGGANWYCQ